MWARQSALTTRLALQFPIVQAPMAKAVSPQLVASVCNEGALGSLPAEYLSIDEIRKNIQSVKRLTEKAFAVNVFVPPLTVSEVSLEKREKMLSDTNEIRSQLHLKRVNTMDDFKAKEYCTLEEKVDVILEENVKVFSFTFGIPAKDIIERLKSKGVTIIGTANTVAEGVALEKSGVDFIVAQGMEAGGHRASFIEDGSLERQPLTALIPQLKECVSTPIIAAGGIMDGNDIASALLKGACAVQMGTAFLPCRESIANELWKKTLLDKQFMLTHGTVITRSVTGRHSRWIRNRIVEQLHSNESGSLPYGAQAEFLSDISAKARELEDAQLSPMFSGINGFKCSSLPTGAADIIKHLVEQVSRSLA